MRDGTRVDQGTIRAFRRDRAPGSNLAVHEREDPWAGLALAQAAHVLESAKRVETGVPVRHAHTPALRQQRRNVVPAPDGRKYLDGHDTPWIWILTRLCVGSPLWSPSPIAATRGRGRPMPIAWVASRRSCPVVLAQVPSPWRVDAGSRPVESRSRATRPGGSDLDAAAGSGTMLRRGRPHPLRPFVRRMSGADQGLFSVGPAYDGRAAQLQGPALTPGQRRRRRCLDPPADSSRQIPAGTRHPGRS